MAAEPYRRSKRPVDSGADRQTQKSVRRQPRWVNAMRRPRHNGQSASIAPLRSAPHRAARDRSGETVIAGMRTALPAPEAHSQNPEPTLKRRNRLMVEADFA